MRANIIVIMIVLPFVIGLVFLIGYEKYRNPKFTFVKIEQVERTPSSDPSKIEILSVYDTHCYNFQLNTLTYNEKFLVNNEQVLECKIVTFKDPNLMPSYPDYTYSIKFNKSSSTQEIANGIKIIIKNYIDEEERKRQKVVEESKRIEKESAELTENLMKELKNASTTQGIPLDSRGACIWKEGYPMPEDCN